MAIPIDVWCVSWGDKYHTDYVHLLQSMVAKHLSVPHTFKCLTDKDIKGVVCVKPTKQWHGWWQKLCLFGQATGPSLYFDVDVVMT